MTDGSNLGIDARRALDTILGGGAPSPGPEEQKSKEEVLAIVTEAYENPNVWANTKFSYAGVTNAMTGALLAMYEAQPETKDLEDPWKALMEFVTPEFSNKTLDQCSGFMWGFAVNQARWLSDLPIGGNPAILTADIVLPEH